MNECYLPLTSLPSTVIGLLERFLSAMCRTARSCIYGDTKFLIHMCILSCTLAQCHKHSTTTLSICMYVHVQCTSVMLIFSPENMRSLICSTPRARACRQINNRHNVIRLNHLLVLHLKVPSNGLRACA